jgi:hypothetical protein
MPSGPSKKELDMYWKNSRQYFDELAEHYRQTDPGYYKEYIAPYYANPFVSQGNSGSVQVSGSGGSKTVPVMVSAALLVASLSAGIFFILQTEQAAEDKGGPVERNVEPVKPVQPDAEKKNETVPEETPATIKPSEDYEKGLGYFSNKEFDKAEEHLKKVPADDPNYKNAQRRLQFIRDNKESGRDNYRRKPIERVR